MPVSSVTREGTVPSHGPWESLPERVGRLEATNEILIRELEHVRKELANAREVEAILRRAQSPAMSGTGPLPVAPPPVPRPRAARHRSPLPPGERWLRVVRLAAPAAALALAGILAGVLPVVRADDIPARAAVTPHALCDPDGFAPPSQDGIWRLMMAPHPARVPCIEQPPPFTGG